MPFWDYWLPLMALLKGRPLKALLSPIALHVAHETRWDNTIYVFFHALIAAVLDVCGKTRERDSSAERRQFDLLLDVISHVYGDVFERGTKAGADGNTEPRRHRRPGRVLRPVSEVAVHHIKSRAQAVHTASTPGMTAISALRRGLDAHGKGDLASGGRRPIMRRSRPNPRTAEAAAPAGVVAFQLGDLLGAERLIERALDLRPDFVDALSNLATVLQTQGRDTTPR